MKYKFEKFDSLLQSKAIIKVQIYSIYDSSVSKN
jgi:hypothetical protein